GEVEQYPVGGRGVRVEPWGTADNVGARIGGVPRGGEVVAAGQAGDRAVGRGDDLDVDGARQLVAHGRHPAERREADLRPNVGVRTDRGSAAGQVAERGAAGPGGEVRLGQ